MKTYSEMYLQNRKLLSDTDCENPQLEAKLILAHASDNTVSELISKFSLYASSDVEKRNSEYIKRRLDNEPVAYIISSAEFYGLPFYVDKSVLIPRIDTETAIDCVKELFQSDTPLKILDLCSGSGAIGCTLAHEFPCSHVVCADISTDAVNVCRKNISLLGLSSRVICVEADASADPPIGFGMYDLLISNPPYIRKDEIPALDNSVKDYEPIIALDGGDDGLDFYKNIISRWSVVIEKSGISVFEVGEEQSDSVIELLKENGFDNCEARKDSYGTNRVVIGKKI